MNPTNCLSNIDIENLLSNSADSSKVSEFESHLETCADCVKKLEAASLNSVTGILHRQLSGNKSVIDSTKNLAAADTNEPRDSATGGGTHIGELPKIPGYEIKRLVGRGGMGIVYEAKQQNLNRDVAIKMISAGFMAGPEKIARFYREAESVARIDHPNVIKIFDVGEAEGCPYFTMELVAGASLERVFDGTPWSNTDAAKISRTVAHAIESVHDHGIIHRDIKPGNILLKVDHGGTFDSLKVTDFGLAKTDFQSDLTQTGQAMGTPAYLAPEQANGEAAKYGPWTDVYAIGSVLYELLTGRPPHAASTVAETLRQIAEKDPVEPNSINPDISQDLSIICMKCLRKDPMQRYSTASQLSQDLTYFLDGKPISARPVSMIEKTWKVAKRHPALSSTLALLVTSVITLLIVWGIFTSQLAAAKKLAENNEIAANNNARLAQQNAKQAAEEEKLAVDNERKAREEAERANREAQIAKDNVRDALYMFDGTREILALLIDNLTQVSQQVSDGAQFDITKVLDVREDDLEEFKDSPFTKGRLHKMLGITFFKNDLASEAVRHLEKADKLLDIDSKAAMAERFQVRHTLALAYRDVKRFDEALEILDQLLAPVWNPKYPKWKLPPPIREKLESFRTRITELKEQGDRDDS